ncbi:HAD-IIIA family hydrolase [Undibacterium cyanobacteriorum]|uniref:HAD-IIIA family hydrolase n=1 Tax=Undibacterium cyanobacteriorum TaxID=3073561 RepID=A0ABY9RDF5_9BURK|nr:HAD-IIIA family hydrolase [Undibacterium sp. 20NA77.5]WMW79199.1 HAD-IIIA family hydrolase [Undibacterium sp. 20NA77.5]
MPNKRFDFIVFDWDGTLMDSTMTIVRSLQGAAKDLGLPVPTDKDASHVIGLGLQEAIARVFPEMDGSMTQKVIDRYRVHYFTKDHELPLFEGVREMITDLAQQGYFLAVATGKSRVGLNRALHTSKLSSFFDATRCADETFSKPHPAMLQELTRELGQDMRRTVMIGDTTHDLQMANNAGAVAVAVEYGAHDPQTLQTCAPIFSAKNVPDLHQWLVQPK